MQILCSAVVHYLASSLSYSVLPKKHSQLFTLLLCKAVAGKIDLDLLKYTRAQYLLGNGKGIILFYCYDLNTGLEVRSYVGHW